MGILDATYDAIMRDEVLRVNFYGRAREVAADNERLRAENAKMREALEKIAKEQSGVTAFQVADWFQQIARDALQPVT